MNEPIEFKDDLDRLRQAVASGEVSGVVPLADELAERGHPYAEELCLIATVVATSESFALAAMAFSFFVQLACADVKDVHNDAVAADMMERLGALL